MITLTLMPVFRVFLKWICELYLTAPVNLTRFVKLIFCFPNRLEQLRDESDLVANAEEIAAARQMLARDPAFVLDMLTKMRSGLSRPMEK